MPNLKIAAFHDNRRSLGPAIQLVGLLARTQSSTPIGPASVFVSRDPTTQFSPLRKLLRDHRLRRFVVAGALAGQADPVQRPLVEMQQHTAERGSFCGEPVFDLHRRTGVDDTFDEPARFEVLQALREHPVQFSPTPHSTAADAARVHELDTLVEDRRQKRRCALWRWPWWTTPPGPAGRAFRSSTDTRWGRQYPSTLSLKSTLFALSSRKAPTLPRFAITPST
jgi:hypothetical protein